MAKRYDPIMCMMVEEVTTTNDASPGWVVDYVSGYAGNGVNNTEREVFRTEQEARKRANELKNKGITGIKVWRHSSMYNDSVIDRAIKTMDEALQEVESKGPYMLAKGNGGKWAVLKNGMPLKYGTENDMRKFYFMVLKNNGY